MQTHGAKKQLCLKELIPDLTKCLQKLVKYSEESEPELSQEHNKHSDLPVLR